MKPLALLISFFLFVQSFSYSQNIIYSTIQKGDKRNTYFEILGKSGANFIVYKKKSGDHYLSFYDANLQLGKEVLISDIPSKAYNLDFVKGNDFVVLIYQYQKNNIVYCGALKLNSQGDIVVAPKIIDTSRVSFFSDLKIYATTFSEDKKQILIYKRNIRSNQIYLSAIVVDSDLNIKNRYKQQFLIDVRKENYSDFYINNKGVFVFFKQTYSHEGDYANTLTLLLHSPFSDSLKSQELNVKNLYLSDPLVRFDHVNNRLIVSALYYQNKRGNIGGFFAVQVDPDLLTVSNAQTSPLSEELKTSLSKNNRKDFDDWVLQQIIIKKNGGFMILAEDLYSETYNNNRWDRNFFNPYYSPYAATNDYYLFNPYGMFYRPEDAYRTNQNVRYYYNDIIIANFDSLFNMKWDATISKKQVDVEQDNFMSYISINTGKGLQFLYVDSDGEKNVIFRNSLSSAGEVKRYPTINSFEKEYEFMPKLSKQTGTNELIMPFFYLNRLGFAKIELN